MTNKKWKEILKNFSKDYMIMNYGFEHEFNELILISQAKMDTTIYILSIILSNKNLNIKVSNIDDNKIIKVYTDKDELYLNYYVYTDNLYFVNKGDTCE